MQDQILAALGNPVTWIFISFVIFVVVVGRRASRYLVGSLDQRSQRIGTDLESARTLRAEAEALHKEQMARAQRADAEAEAILEQGRATATFVRDDAKEQLRSLLQRALEARQ